MRRTPSHRQIPVFAASIVLLGGCRGEPPEALGGVELTATQQEVLAFAESRGSFSCRLRSSRPKLTVCEGPTEDGTLTVVILGDTVDRLELRLEPDPDEEPGRTVQRFTRGLGDPAWRDRPVPPRVSPPRGYHTLWVDPDTTRAIALVCDRPRLEPPCTAELVATSPGGLLAKLDTLLGIRR